MRQRQFLAPWIIQVIGLLLLLAGFVFWGVTGRQSTEFIAAAMTMITIGIVAGAYQRVQASKEAYEQPPKEERPK